MAEPYSPLTLVLAELLDRGFGVARSAELLGQLETIVGDHALEGDKAPAWMLDFCSRVLHRRWAPRNERYEIPTGYPLGENGLNNVLTDIEQGVHPMNLDDYGEGMVWLVPGLSVRVCVIREWNGAGCGVLIEPLGA